MQNDMKEEESFLYLSQALSLMDLKTYFAIKAFINDHHEREGHLPILF